MSLKNKVEKIVNDRKILNTLNNLSARWQDEKEFEDWKEYEKAMSQLTNYKFKKGTKRPFGFVIEVDKTNVAIQLKKRGNSVNLLAKIV